MTDPNVREAIELIDTAVKTTNQTQEILTRPGVVEALHVIGCDIDARPKGAPKLEDVKHHIVAVRRDGESLTVEFTASAAADVAAFVAAEQQCCSEVMFSMVPGDQTLMQVRATVELVDMVEGWMTQVS